MGKVVATYQGKDGLVRAVDVQTETVTRPQSSTFNKAATASQLKSRTSVFRRPISKLALLLPVKSDQTSSRGTDQTEPEDQSSCDERILSWPGRCSVTCLHRGATISSEEKEHISCKQFIHPQTCCTAALIHSHHLANHMQSQVIHPIQCMYLPQGRACDLSLP